MERILSIDPLAYLEIPEAWLPVLVCASALITGVFFVLPIGTENTPDD